MDRVEDGGCRLVGAQGRLIDSDTRGDPATPLRWTCKSTRALAAQLTRHQHPISHVRVAQLLHAQGCSLQGNRKTQGGRRLYPAAKYLLITADAGLRDDRQSDLSDGDRPGAPGDLPPGPAQIPDRPQGDRRTDAEPEAAAPQVSRRLELHHSAQGLMRTCYLCLFTAPKGWGLQPGVFHEIHS